MSIFKKLISSIQGSGARGVLPAALPWFSRQEIKVPKERLSLTAQLDKLSAIVLGAAPDGRRADELLAAARGEVDKASLELDTLLREMTSISAVPQGPATGTGMTAAEAPPAAPLRQAA